MVRLGDVVDLDVGFAFKSSQFTDNAAHVRLLRGENVGQGFVRWNRIRYVDPATSGVARKYALRRGDLVLAMDRPWIEGGLKFATIRADDLPSLLVQRVARIRATSNVDQGFLRYVIRGPDFVSHLLGMQTGSAIPHISGRQIAEFEIPRFPPLPEQRGIAATLGALDDKIDSNRRVQRVCEDLVRAQVDRILTESSFEDARLGDYCELINDYSRPNEIDPAAFYLGLEHMPRGSIVLTKWSSAARLGSHKARFARGDVLFGKLRPYFRKVGVAPVDGVCSTDILVLRPARFDRALVAVVASSLDLIESLSASATGTRMPRAQWRDLADWPVPALGATERERLGSATQPLLDHIERLTFENIRLAALRDALLPELLSGRIRVPEARELVEGAT